MSIGLCQGCVLSPILFALFLADFEPYLKTICCGAKLLELYIRVLLFADDIAI